MPEPVPRPMQFPVVPQPELVPNRQPDFAALELWEIEIRDAGSHKTVSDYIVEGRRFAAGSPFLIETHVPSDGHVILCQRLLELLVVVALDLDERPKDILILICVLVS